MTNILDIVIFGMKALLHLLISSSILIFGCVLLPISPIVGLIFIIIPFIYEFRHLDITSLKNIVDAKDKLYTIQQLELICLFSIPCVIIICLMTVNELITLLCYKIGLIQSDLNIFNTSEIIVFGIMSFVFTLIALYMMEILMMIFLAIINKLNRGNEYE